MKNKRLFKLAKDGAEKIIIVDVDGNDSIRAAAEKVEKQTGAKNLLATSGAGGLVHVGWRSLVWNDVKTLCIRADERF